MGTSSSVSLYFLDVYVVFLSATKNSKQDPSKKLYMVSNVVKKTEAISKKLIFCIQTNSRSLSSNYLNVRRLHVQSTLRVPNERMTIDFQEEQKQNKLQCSVRN